MSATRNSRAFSNVQLQSLRYQRNAIPAAGGVMSVDSDGTVGVTTALSIGSLHVTGQADLGLVTADHVLTNRFNATIGATITSLDATSAVVRNLDVRNRATAQLITVKTLNITDTVYPPASVIFPNGSSAFLGVQVVAGTTDQTILTDHYALDVSGSARISGGMTVTDLVITENLTIPNTITFPEGNYDQLNATQIHAGSNIPPAPAVPYSLYVSDGLSVFEEGVTMYGPVEATSISVLAMNIVDELIFDPSAHIVIPTTYVNNVLSQQIVAGSTADSELALMYALDVVGNSFMQGGLTVTGRMVGSGGLTTTTGFFSSGLTAAGGLTSTVGNFSSNVVVGGGLTVTGLLVGSGGLTATTGNFSSTLVSSGISTGGVTATTGRFTSTLLVSSGISTTGITATTGNFSNTLLVSSGISTTGITATTGNFSSTLISTGISTGGVTATTGRFTSSLLVSSGISTTGLTATTGNFSGNVTLTGGATITGSIKTNGLAVTTDGSINISNTASGLLIGQGSVGAGGVYNLPNSNGAAFTWNTIGGGGNLELVLGSGGVTGNAFNIYNTKGALGTTANQNIFTLQSTGDLTVIGSISSKGISGTTANFSGGIASKGISGTTASFSGNISSVGLSGTTANFSGGIASRGISGTTAYFGPLTLAGPIYTTVSSSKITAPVYAWRYVASITGTTTSVQYQPTYASIDVWQDAWANPASYNGTTTTYTAGITGLYSVSAMIRLTDGTTNSAGMFFSQYIGTTAGLTPGGVTARAYSAQGVITADQNPYILDVSGSTVIFNPAASNTSVWIEDSNSTPTNRRTTSTTQLIKLNAGDGVALSFCMPDGAIFISGAVFSGYLLCALP
jgi:hypothetical protein